MAQLFTTNSVAPSDRLDFWRDAICDVYVQLDCRFPPARRFNGSVACQPVGPISLSVVTAGAQHVLRTPRQIAKAQAQTFLLSVQLAGSGTIRQDGRVAELRPGSMALYDSTRPYDLIFQDDFQQLVLQLPHDRLRALVPEASRLTATTLCRERLEVRLLLGALTGVQGDFTELAAGAPETVAEGLANLLAAALAPGRGDSSACAPLTVSRIKAFVRARLADPELTPATVAQHFGMSLRHLHRLFAGEDRTLERYVLHERLQRAARVLKERGDSAITGVAFECGFVSGAHFSRSFKDCFGVTPREFRNTQLP